MNNIALFLAQLSGVQGAGTQKGVTSGGETATQNNAFLNALLVNLQNNPESSQFQTQENATPILKQDVLSFLKSGQIANFSETSLNGEALVASITIDDASETNISLEQLNSQIEILRQKIELFQEAEQNNKPVNLLALIASGLTPSQLSELQQNVKDLENKLGRPITIEDLIAGVGGLIPQKETEAPVSDELTLDSSTNVGTVVTEQSESSEASEVAQENPKSNSQTAQPEVSLVQYIKSLLPADKTTNTATAIPSTDIAEITGIEDVIPTTEDGESSEELAVYLNAIPVGGEARAAYIGNEAARLRNGQAPGIIGQGAGAQNSAPQAAIPAVNNNILQSLNTVDGETLAFNTPLPFEGDVPFSSMIDIESGLPFSNTTQAAHMITQATQQAGQSHPATQMVSAKLQQAAQSGQNQTLTLYLEPADLGRVEVRMEFGPDKMLKTTMLIEKPETYHMLHRDSFALERALQESGLDIDGSGIEFELAEDGHAFDQNNDGQGGGEKYGGASGDAEGELLNETEILETTMTWDVDPDTGHVHYNILA